MWTRTEKMSNVVTIINVTSFQTCHPPSTESSAESTIQSLKQQPSLRVFLQFFSICFFLIIYNSLLVFHLSYIHSMEYSGQQIYIRQNIIEMFAVL